MTTSTHKLTQPAERAVRAVNNAHQIAIGIRDVTGDDGGSVAEDGGRIAQLLADVPSDIVALQQHIDRLQEDLRGLRDQGLEDARTISAERERGSALNGALQAANTRLALASRDVEQLLQTVSIRLQGETADFNRIRGLRDVLDLSTVVEDHGDFSIIDTRRTAAAGAR